MKKRRKKKKKEKKRRKKKEENARTILCFHSPTHLLLTLIPLQVNYESPTSALIQPICPNYLFNLLIFPSIFAFIFYYLFLQFCALTQ